MDKLFESIVTIAGLIVAVAIVSVLVSPKANTSNVVQSFASGFGNNLAVAIAPVTGANTPITLAYPGSGYFGGNSSMGGGMGLPSFQ
jgi:ketol-acid reductoisomerase